MWCNVTQLGVLGCRGVALKAVVTLQSGQVLTPALEWVGRQGPTTYDHVRAAPLYPPGRGSELAVVRASVPPSRPTHRPVSSIHRVQLPLLHMSSLARSPSPHVPAHRGL